MEDELENDDLDVCEHGISFSEDCEDCEDEEDDFADETIPVCPECGSDDLSVTGQDANGENEYVCEDCGEEFGEEDLEEDQ